MRPCARTSSFGALGLTIFASIAVAGCGSSNTNELPVTNHTPPAETEAGLRCELTLQHQGPDELALLFVIVNGTRQPVTIHYDRPFMQFELRITAAGVERSISEPVINMPVESQQLELVPRGRASFNTPVRLRFASRPSAATDSFIWTISGEPAPIEVRATIRIDGITVSPCVARI